MAARRLIVVLLALLVVSSIAAALAPVRSSEEDDPETSETTTPAPPPGKFVRRNIDAGSEKPETIALELGDELTLTVTSERVVEVGITGLGELEDAAPGAPARFDLLPHDPGSYDVRLLDSGRRLGTIEVSPRDARKRERPAKRPERESSARNDSRGRS